jgi:polysaccharide chain length determinant protein (PEP-CTERM system associated)
MVPGRKYDQDLILDLLLKGRWILILSVAVFAAVASLYSLRLPNRYRSETMIMVVPQQIPQDYVRPTVTTPPADRLRTMREQILSRSNLERIVNEFDLYAEQRRTQTMEDVVERMRTNDISIDIVKISDSFRVGYESTDPVIAMKVTERLAYLFMAENVRDRTTLAASTSKFLEAQLEDAKTRLDEEDRKIEEYRRQHSGELPSQLEFNLQAMQSTQIQLQTLLDSLTRDRDRKYTLELTVADLSSAAAPVVAPPPNAAPRPPTGELASEDAPLAVQLEAAREFFKAVKLRATPAHPDYKRAERIVQTLEQRAATEAAAPPSTIARPLTQAEITRRERLSSARVEIEGLQRTIEYREGEAKRLQAKLDNYKSRIEAVPARESEFAALTRNYASLKSIYESLLKKREDSKVAEDLEKLRVGEQFRVIDPPRRAERPFRPNRMQFALGGAGIGLLLGVGLIGLFEYLNRGLRTEAEIVALLGLPVVAQIPAMQGATERKRRKTLGYVMDGAGAALTVVCLAVVVYVLRNS